jgi:thymidylate kinase
VRDGYLELARGQSDRFRVIDAAQDETRVREDIRSAVEMFLNQRRKKSNE